MSNFLQNLINKFYKKEDKFIPSNYAKIDNTNVQFYLDSNLEPNIKVFVSDTSKESAYAFADMLCDINRGKYIDSILQTLLSMGAEDREINQFVKNVLSFWSNIEKKTEINKLEPQVKPTEFFRVSKHGT